MKAPRARFLFQESLRGFILALAMFMALGFSPKVILAQDEAPLAEPEPAPPTANLRVGGLLVVPSGDVLAHTQYRFNGSLQYFSSTQFMVGDSGANDGNETRQFNYGTELLLGLQNRAEVGFFYGQDFALSFKALLIEEDALWPNVVFGIRSLFGSPEADLYGVTDATTVRSLRGESFAIVAKTFALNTRLHAGGSMLNGANKSLFSFDFGLEQNLGAGAFLGYELFERYSDFHQNVSLTWRFGPVFAMHLALTELQSWVRQKGEWGFFLTPANPQMTGYNAPGVRFALQVNGYMPRVAHKTLSERVSDLEKTRKKSDEKIQMLQGQLVKLRLEQSTHISPSASPQDPKAAVLNWLDSLASSLMATPTDLGKMGSLLPRMESFPTKARPLFAGIAMDTSRTLGLRLASTVAMGHTQDSTLVAPLKWVCADPNPRLRREALTALGRIGHLSALDIVKRMIDDPDPVVSVTAEEVAASMEGKNDSFPEAAAEEKPPQAEIKSKAVPSKSEH